MAEREGKASFGHPVRAYGVIRNTSAARSSLSLIGQMGLQNWLQSGAGEPEDD